jgi:hypothetical protein
MKILVYIWLLKARFKIILTIILIAYFLQINDYILRTSAAALIVAVRLCYINCIAAAV